MPHTAVNKEKLKYNVAQNCVYIIKNAWKHKKSVPLIIVAQAVVAVTLSTLILFMPKQIIYEITSQNGVKAILLTAAGFALAIMLVSAIKVYFEQMVKPSRSGLRALIVNDILMKIVETDYVNLEAREFNLAKERSQHETSNNEASSEAVYYTMAELLTSVLGFAVYCALLASVNPFVLLLTGATALTAFFARRAANKWCFEHDNELMAPLRRMYTISNVGTAAQYAKDLRLYAMTGWLNDIYNSLLNIYYDVSKRSRKRIFIADVIVCLSSFLREGIVYAFLIYQVLNGLSLDNFVLLFAAVGGFSTWITGILLQYAELSRHSLGYCKIRAFLEYPNTYKREDGEQPPKADSYTLQAKNLSFKYPGAADYILKNINLTVSAGERLAVVGLNGAGKTTLVKLLCGFYNPTEGQILLNGTDICSFNRPQYYKLFSAVFQEFNILPTTVAENVAQQPENEIDRERLWQCLTLADIDKRVSLLPQKESSMLVKSVNEEAAELSGGETQRLMLARALYKNAPLLILDEPTAALDAIAESKLYEKYNELSQGKTSVYISHRLASTRFCDRIILIADKSIAECGTHAQLLSMGGKYAELFEIQSKYYKDDNVSEGAVKGGE